LINHLLDLAKIEASEILMVIEDLPVSKALEDCVSMAQSLIKGHNIELIVEPTPSA
jgi:signal transduction histidine kinase